MTRLYTRGHMGGTDESGSGPSGRPLRQHVTVHVVTNLAPCQLAQRMPGKQRPLDGRELHPHADFLPPARQVAADEKLVIAEPPVGCLHVVLRGTELALGVGVDARVRPSEIPDASRL